jgi:hypothetical protein
MADSQITTIPLCLSRDEALAHLAGRPGEADCARFASLRTSHGNRPDADVIWSELGASLGGSR